MFRQLDYLADILLLLPGLQRQEPSYISTSLGAVQAPAGRIAAAFGFGMICCQIFYRLEL